jgi:beta-galactosidase
MSAARDRKSGSQVVAQLKEGLMKMHSTRGSIKLSITLARSFLIAIEIAFGAARTAPAQQTESSARLAPLTDQLRLGAEYFLNRNDTQESVRRHFQLMHHYGLTIARIFIIWDDIERQRDQWDLHRYDWIYDAAHESGIKIAATLCAEDPPGWMKLTPFYHHRMNLNDPALRERSAIYIQKVVGRYRNHLAQGPWLLMNEPGLEVNYERTTMEAFGKWLERRYGTVDRLNAHWFQPLANFSDVQLSPDQWTSHWADYDSFIDWKEFNIDDLCDFLRWIKQQIWALDTAHATHVNPPGLIRNLAAGGSDPWKEAEIVDFLGTSIHPAWNFGEYERSEFGLPFAYCLDLLRSASGERPWWVTELQGGPTVYTGGRAMNPTPSELTRWMWDSFGAGSRAVVFWLWNPRFLGNEGGEWGLVGLDGEPSPRLEAVKAIADALKRLPELAQAKPVPRRVGIIYNPETLLLIEMDGRAQAAAKRSQEPLWSLEGTYAALHRAHIAVDFVHLDDLKRGEAQRYGVLYLPYSYSLDDNAVNALREYVRNGGILWADGLPAWKNEYGEVRSRIPGALGDVFGADAPEVEPVDGPYSVTAADEKAGELWRLPLEMKGAQILLRDRDGKPFATRHAFGKGQAIYYATALTLAYRRRNNEVVQKWIAQPALTADADTPVKLERGSGRISFRSLTCRGKAFAVLSNWGPTETVTVSFTSDYSKVIDALAGRAMTSTPSKGKTLVTTTLPAGQVLVLEAQLRP